MTDINNKPKVGIYDSMKETIREQEAERKRLLSIKPRYMSTAQPTKTRLKGYDRILAASKSLPLKDRVELVNQLNAINENEVEEIERKAQEGRALLKA